MQSFVVFLAAVVLAANGKGWSVGVQIETREFPENSLKKIYKKIVK